MPHLLFPDESFPPGRNEPCFCGSGQRFTRLSYTLKPKAGMLVWFPSDVRYEHMLKLVISGRRYSLASRAAVTDVERVQAERAKRSILWSESHA